MKRLLTAIAALLILGMSGCATTDTLTFLPKNMNIVPPDPSIGGIVKYSGIWRGNWDNELKQATTVVFEKIDQNEVLVIYSWGPYKGFPGDGVRVRGQVKSDSVIILEWGDGQKKTVTLTLDGETIRAEYRKGGQVNHATLTRAPASNSP